MKSKRPFYILIAVLSLLAILPLSILAQSASTAALTGTITDATGAVVPNATIMLTNTGTNQTRFHLVRWTYRSSEYVTILRSQKLPACAPII